MTMSVLKRSFDFFDSTKVYVLTLICAVYWTGVEHGLYAQHELDEAAAERIIESLLNAEIPEDISKAPGESLWWLSDDQQNAGKANLDNFYQAHSQLRQMNPNVEGLRNFSWDRTHFISQAAFAKSSILSVTPTGDVELLRGRQVNVFKGLEAVGVIQTHRPAGYIKESVQDLNGLPLPSWQMFNLIFAKKPPPAIQERLHSLGYSDDEHFSIYFVPNAYEYAVGSKIPLFGITLPTKILKSQSTGIEDETHLDLEDLDFHRANYIALNEAMALAAKSGTPELALEAGLHIPFKKKRGQSEEQSMKLRVDFLMHIERVLHRTFLMNVGLSNVRNFEELRKASVGELPEVVISKTFDSFTELNEFNTFLPLFIEESLSSPPVLDNNRVRDVGMSISGPGSKTARMAVRIARRMGLFLDLTEKKLSYSSDETEEEARSEYSVMIRNLRESFRKLERSKNQKNQAFLVRESLPEVTNFERQENTYKPSAVAIGLKHLQLAALCAVPAAMTLLAGNLSGVLHQEGHRIAPYAITALLIGGITSASFTAAAYLRNVTIRDVRGLGRLYSDLDEKSQKVLEKAEAEHVKPQQEGEPKKKEPKHQLESERLKNQIRSTNNVFKKIGLFGKKSIVDIRDKVFPLEGRLQKIEKMEIPPQELRPLELFASNMRRVFRISLFAWHRAATRLMFPFLFDTWKQGGKINFKDWGLWPRGFYTSLRVITLFRESFNDQAVDVEIDGKEYSIGSYEQNWILANKKRKVEIGKYNVVGPAIGRAVVRLQAAKALELGIHPAVITFILSSQTYINENSHSWLAQLNSRLPEENQIEKENLKVFLNYCDELLLFSRDPGFQKEMMDYSGEIYRQRLTTNEGERKLEWSERVVLVAAKAQNILYENLGERGLDEFEIQSISTKAKVAWSKWAQNFENKIGRIGTNAENMTSGTSWASLGNWIPTLLMERAIISSQVIPPMMENSFHVGMSEAEFFNGLAPLFVFAGPENLFQFAGSLAGSSVYIDQLLEESARNRDAGYWTRLFSSVTNLPMRNIILQSASLWDVRLQSATNSAFLMATGMVGMDVGLGLIHKGVASIDLGTSILGRSANFAAAASFNSAFSTFSIPAYRILYSARRSAGGIPYNGHINPGETKHNPHRIKDQLVGVGSNLVMNMIYGFSAGQIIPDMSHWIQGGESFQLTGTELIDPSCSDNLASLTEPSVTHALLEKPFKP